MHLHRTAFAMLCHLDMQRYSPLGRSCSGGFPNRHSKHGLQRNGSISTPEQYIRSSSHLLLELLPI